MCNSVFSGGKRRDSEWCCQCIASNRSCNCERRISYGNITKVLAAEGYRGPKQTVWDTIRKYKTHTTLSRLPGSGHRFKLTSDILAIIEDQMTEDDETTATQLVKIVNTAGYNVSKSTIIRAWRILG